MASPFQQPTALNTFTNSLTPPAPSSVFKAPASTPQTTAPQFSNAGFLGTNAITTPLKTGSLFSPVQGQNVNKPTVTPTATGGATLNPAAVAAYNQPAQAIQPEATPPNLSQYLPGTSAPTSGGGSVSTAHDGSVTGYTPSSGFSIDTSSVVPSDALGSYANPYQTHQTLQDYVNALAQAQGYSPDYIHALQAQQGAQLQGAQLNLNQAQLNSNFYTGNNLPGDTLNYAQGATAKAEAQQTLNQAENQIQQLGADQALQTQQLARTGNIAAAQAQLQYSPQAVAYQDAQAQYNALQLQYPSANLPAFNAGANPLAQLQMAHQIVSASPQFQQQFQSTYTTPGGGTGIYNRLMTGQLQPGPNGTIQLVSGADAQLGAAQTAALSDAVGTYNTLKPAFQAANNDFTAMTQFMQQAGINDNSTPIINQIDNKIKAGLIQPGAVAAFKSYVASLRTNYANLLGARGETPTQAGNTANELIPDNLGVKDMLQIQQALNTNGGNILDATGQQIDTILNASRTGQTGVSGYGNNAAPTGGSIYDF